MALSPKSTGDQLEATLWNIVQALAEAAMRGTNNLSEIADPATARAALLLADVAATGSYDDLADLITERRDDFDGFKIADVYGDTAMELDIDGQFTFALLKAIRLLLGDDTEVAENTASTDAFAIGDPYGGLAFRVLQDGRVGVPGVTFGEAPAGYALVIADEFGDIGGYVTDSGAAGGFLAGSSGTGGGESSLSSYSAEEQARRGASALATSALVATQTNTTAARPVWKYSHVLAYGQSLSSGWEAWPRLSTAQPHDNLMVGDSVRPVSESGAAWVQVGTSQFNALVATVMTNSTSGAIVADGTVAGYSAGNTALGETPLEGAVNFWRRQQLNARGLASDSTRLLVASSCGVGGRSIEALSHGASPHLFNRLVDCATLAKGLATAASATYGVAAVLFIQGEDNASNTSGTTDKDTYKALLATWQEDIATYVSSAVAGQSAPPAVFSYQTSTGYVLDANYLGVSQAQLEAAQEFRDWYLVAPSYPVTNKTGGHLDPNGSRWLGMQFGKVMHQVLDLGRGWKPLHPTRATWRGSQVLIDFHVPHPPLQFQSCYVATTSTDYTAKGFKVTDDSGTLSILSVEIVGDACVLITLSGDIGTNPYVWYGAQSPSAGNGNLCDSDPTTASAAYEYNAGTGQYAAAEISALIDAPYPLWNWCCLFRMAIEHDPA